MTKIIHNITEMTLKELLELYSHFSYVESSFAKAVKDKKEWTPEYNDTLTLNTWCRDAIEQEIQKRVHFGEQNKQIKDLLKRVQPIVYKDGE